MSLLELVSLASPARCAGCRRPGSPLCRECRDGIGKPYVPQVPGVDQVLVGFPYEGAARSLVLDLKLKGDRGAALPLAEALIRGVAAEGLSAEIVTWIPGRAHENRRRGLDHAGILAARVGHGLGLPVQPLLTHTSERPDQASLGAAERWANLRGGLRCPGLSGKSCARRRPRDYWSDGSGRRPGPQGRRRGPGRGPGSLLGVTAWRVRNSKARAASKRELGWWTAFRGPLYAI